MKAETYEISDFYLAVTLLSLGYSIINFDVTDPKRVVFIFALDEGLLDSVQSFWNDEVRINPKLVFAYQKELKGRMSQIIR